MSDDVVYFVKMTVLVDVIHRKKVIDQKQIIKNIVYTTSTSKKAIGKRIGYENFKILKIEPIKELGYIQK